MDDYKIIITVSGSDKVGIVSGISTVLSAESLLNTLLFMEVKFLGNATVVNVLQYDIACIPISVLGF